MKQVIFPQMLQMTGPEVANLQSALQLTLDRGVILANDEAARRELSAVLQRELARQSYQEATRKLVSLFQEAKHLQASGAVDEPTANAINALLREWGVLDQGPRFHIVTGAVRREDGLPLQGLRVRAVHEAERRIVRLGEDTTDADGRYTIRYEPALEAINLRVSAVDEDGRSLQASDLVHNAQPLESLDLTTPIAGRQNTQQRIEGRIILEHGLPAARTKLRLYRHDFGGRATMLGETTTLAGGEYAFTYDAGNRGLSLEVRTLTDAGQEIPLSEPLNNLRGDDGVVLNLVAPSSMAAQIRLFVDRYSNDQDLEKALFVELGSYYQPSADNVSPRKWLQEVASLLDTAATETQSQHYRESND